MESEMTKHTSDDYKYAARANLWFAKMARLYGRKDEAEGHYKLAELYIKQELARN